MSERTERARTAGDLSEGPYPFSFRTRQSSLLEPMVLLRGESRLSPALRACFYIVHRKHLTRAGVFVLSYTVLMTWAGKRKLIIIGVLVLVVIILAGAGGYFFFHKAPSCIDGIQNQNEEGIDCGGSCTYLCTASEAEPSVRFARTFSPLPGRTDVIAYVDNPNTNAAAKQAPYKIELYDDQKD